MGKNGSAILLLGIIFLVTLVILIFLGDNKTFFVIFEHVPFIGDIGLSTLWVAAFFALVGIFLMRPSFLVIAIAIVFHWYTVDIICGILLMFSGTYADIMKFILTKPTLPP